MGIFADMLLAAGLRRHDQHVNHISNSLFGSLPEKGRCILCGGVDSGEFSNAKQIKLHAFSSRLQRAARKSLPTLCLYSGTLPSEGPDAAVRQLREQYPDKVVRLGQDISYLPFDRNVDVEDAMILHSTRPAVFVLAMDDCEVQASSGGLPNFCSVLWKNSDGPEALAQDRPLFQRCCWQLDLYEEDPSNLLVQAYDGGCAMPPLCIEVRGKQESTEAVFCFPDGSHSEVYPIACPSSLRITSDREGVLQVEFLSIVDAPAQPDTEPAPLTTPDTGVPDPPGQESPPLPEKALVQAQQEQLTRQQAELARLTAELAALKQESGQLAQEIQLKQSDIAAARSLLADRAAAARSLQKELETVLDASGLDQDTLRCYTGKDGVNALLQESESLTARIQAALKTLIQQRTQEAADRFQSVT